MSSKENVSTEGPFLHLSDLHIGRDHAFRLPKRSASIDKPYTLAEVVARDLGHLGIKYLAGIVVSGDLTTYAQWNDYYEDVLACLRALCSQLGVKNSSVYIVPGNHDYDWYEEISPSVYERVPAQSVATTYAHEIHFQHLLDEFYEQPSKDRLEKIHVHRLSKITVKLKLLDSCKLCPTRFHEYGFVENFQLDQIPKLMDLTDDTQDIRVLVLHHHVSTVIPMEEGHGGKGVSVTLNAGEILDRASRAGVSVILHGHHHYPNITTLRRTYEEDGEFKQSRTQLHIISGGSTGTSRIGGLVTNCYGILAFEEKKLDVRVRRIRPSGDPFGDLLRTQLEL